MAKPQLNNVAGHQWLEEVVRSVAEETSGAVSEDFFQTLVRQLATTLQVRFGFISEVSGTGRLHITALWEGTDFGESFQYNMHGTPCERVFKKGLCYYPSRLQETFPKTRWLQRKGIQSYLAIPLYDSGGSPFGHLGAMHDAPLVDDLPRASILRIFATRAAAELERKHGEDRLREQSTQLSRANQHLSALHAVTVAANQSLKLDTVLQEVIKKITETFQFDETRIYLSSPGTKELHLTAYSGPEWSEPTRTYRRGEGLAAEIAKTGDPLIFENIQTDREYQKLALHRRGQKLGYCFLSVFPIKSKVTTVGNLACYGL